MVKHVWYHAVGMENALREAIRRVGGLAALARQLGISPQAVQQWRIAPAVRTLEIERLTGVSRYELRPDLYPRE
jgi:DNA-binding transcriptional regulator YdaS (Cro superfamily)